MTWEGYNYEDAVLLNERLVRDDVYTSIHIEEYSHEARDTKLGPKKITREIPNVGEDALKDLTPDGIIQHRYRGSRRRHPRRQGHAEGRDRAYRGRETAARHLRREGKRSPRHVAETFRTARAVSSWMSRYSHATTATSFRPESTRSSASISHRRERSRSATRWQAATVTRVSFRASCPPEDMPFLADGTPLDIVLNPLGVPSPYEYRSGA